MSRHFVDNTGRYVGCFGAGVEPEGDFTPVAGPPSHARDIWDFEQRSWIVVAPSFDEVRRAEYRDRIKIVDTIDAIYKGLSLLVPDLIKAGILSPETAAALTPDKHARPDEPAGWLGKVQDIKARNPKP